MHRFPWFVKAAIACLLLGVLVFAGLVLYVCYMEANPPPIGSFDAIVVLGAQVKADGTPSVQLGLRLDTALKAWQEHDVVIVACGAQGGDEPMPEADFMKQWFIERGVPEALILCENQSFNTRQNIDNAMRLLEGHDISRILVVTSDYHLPRALAIAKDAGVSAAGLGSPCLPNRLPFWMKNHFREALAWVKYWGEKHLGLRLP